ncbi:DUF6126 family protein [Actinacidiphila guanduensis]|uniref:Small hydrophobic protein n=1 Tax=Actinacidiphila guanduensis TaxID=310781 RepID=A0A1H0BZ27_9ACTN|nr:DUF6126 family protein [Actinacidiphila guanduensis]SDN50760.1 hypothetical protein SAMN05216259_104356 [Actinacidiphila guanduensis]
MTGTSGASGETSGTGTGTEGGAADGTASGAETPAGAPPAPAAPVAAPLTAGPALPTGDQSERWKEKATRLRVIFYVAGTHLLAAILWFFFYIGSHTHK